MDKIDASVLDQYANTSYPKRMPNEWDEEIAAFVQAVAARGRSSIKDGTLKRSHDWLLLAFAERMASLAVRQQSVVILHEGLVAAGIAATLDVDERDVLLVFAPLCRACELLNVDPKDAFSAAAAAVKHTYAGWLLTSFANRTPEDRSLAVMGYIESADEDGFRFQRTW